MSVHHDPMLVLLSVALAIQASFVGLRLAKRCMDIDGTIRRHILAGAALSLATGIWGMHFVGMLALRLPFAVDYAVLPTLLSFLACVLVVGLALATTAVAPLTWTTLLGAATVMGLGIVTMHYLGMAALHAGAHLEHDWRMVALSILLSVVASAFALWLAFGEASRPPSFSSAVVLGIAISGMHYTAMAGVGLHAHDGGAMAPSADPQVSAGLLALVVALVAFLISGLFVLTLIPDRRAVVPAMPVPPSMPSTSEPSLLSLVAGPELVPAGVPSAGAMPADPPAAFRAATGDMLPVARDSVPQARAAFEPIVEEAAHEPVSPLPLAFVPVLRDGSIRQFPVDQIAAIHANAHYSTVVADSLSLFSPLSISEAAEKLPPEQFMRVHRSHIVNLRRVQRLIKTVDAALVELEGGQGRRVPVARTRLAELRKRLGSGA